MIVVEKTESSAKPSADTERYPISEPNTSPKLSKATKDTKNIKAKKNTRRIDGEHVAFYATTKNLPITSDHYEWVGHGQRIKVKGVHLRFVNGVTQLYNMKNPEHNEFVTTVRDWIAEGFDERIKNCHVREMRANEPAPPLAMWDQLDVEACVSMVRASKGKIDPVEAIRYEEVKELRGEVPRVDVILALEAFIDELETVEDPLSVPEL